MPPETNMSLLCSLSLKDADIHSQIFGVPLPDHDVDAFFNATITSETNAVKSTPPSVDQLLKRTSLAPPRLFNIELPSHNPTQSGLQGSTAFRKHERRSVL